MTDNPILYAYFTTLSSTEPELLPIEVLHGGNREFRVFLRKIVEIIKILVRIPKMTWRWLKHIFRLITDRSSLYTIAVTRIQNVVLRRIGGRGHFRSRDKNWRSHHLIRNGR